MRSLSLSLDCLSMLANLACKSTCLMPPFAPLALVSVADFFCSFVELSLCELLVFYFEFVVFEAVARPCCDLVGPGESTTWVCGLYS